MNEKILVIDDDITFLKMIEMVLEMNNYDPVIVNNGQQALELLEGEKPNLILLDLMMPNMNGFEVLEKLKSSTHTKNIPVVIVSAVEDQESINKVWKMGVIDFIAKGAGLDKLVASIKRNLDSGTVQGCS